MTRKLGPRSVPSSVIERGACRPTVETEPLNFFSSQQPEIRACKNTCAGCPVRMDCLVYALDAKELFGVWGGADGRELRTALNLDRNGAPERTATPNRCPFCRSIKYVEVTRTPKTKTDSASCGRCGLVWRRARSPRASASVGIAEQKTA